MAAPHHPPVYTQDDTQHVERASSRTPTAVDTSDRAEDDDINLQFEHEAYGPAEGEKALDSYEVIMGPDDPDNPKTWSRPYRWYVTMLSAVLVLNAYVLLSYKCRVESSLYLQNVCLVRAIRHCTSANGEVLLRHRSCHSDHRALCRRLLRRTASLGSSL